MRDGKTGKIALQQKESLGDVRTSARHLLQLTTRGAASRDRNGRTRRCCGATAPIRAQGSNMATPVIVVSIVVDPAAAKASSVQEYLLKPFRAGAPRVPPHSRLAVIGSGLISGLARAQERQHLQAPRGDPRARDDERQRRNAIPSCVGRLVWGSGWCKMPPSIAEESSAELRARAFAESNRPCLRAWRTPLRVLGADTAADLAEGRGGSCEGAAPVLVALDAEVARLLAEVGGAIGSPASGDRGAQA